MQFWFNSSCITSPNKLEIMKFSHTSAPHFPVSLFLDLSFDFGNKGMPKILLRVDKKILE